MKLIAGVFAFLFVSILAEKGYSELYQSQEDEDGSLVLVPDKKGNLIAMNVDEIEESVETFISIPAIVRFELYTRDNPEKFQLLSPTNDSLLDTNYDPNRPTRIFIHGWNSQGEMTPLYTDAYFKKGNHNVNWIAVNWRDGSDKVNYVSARRLVGRVGPFVAEFIEYLVNRGNLKLKDLVLVGHSLGAHIAGIAGKNMVSGKIGHIVGLDPALPLFSVNAVDDRLAITDAEYVETVHTSAGRLGFSLPLGHASFYPNGGSRQPGCGWDIGGGCAHARSSLYYAESIYSSIEYLGVRCESLAELQRGRCRLTSESILGRMGGENPSNITKTNGIFFFQTNSKPIFSIGSKIVLNLKLELK